MEYKFEVFGMTRQGTNLKPPTLDVSTLPRAHQGGSQRFEARDFFYYEI